MIVIKDTEASNLSKAHQSSPEQLVSRYKSVKALKGRKKTDCP